MKTIKKARNLSKGQQKDKDNNWKTKAINRRKENEKLRKRNKELIQSRDNWKTKYKTLKKTKKSIGCTLESEKALKHQYSLLIIVLIVELYKYGGMSLRSCRHSLCCMFLCLGLSHKVPSHSSIRNWICKCGFYRVKETTNLSGEYVIYVDESITFGSEKMLLILGVELEKVNFKQSLSHNDMSVLYVGSGNEWKGEDIKKELEKIAADKTIKYVVSDQGRNLCKAYKLLNYRHIEDCTHVLANYLKSIYNKDADFEAFRKLIGKLRRDWNLSKSKSQYMPPTMRGKMRFANIFPCVNWAKKTLAIWDKLSKEVQDRLSFLKENSAFIQSLIEVETIFKMVCSKLKNGGFSLSQKQIILEGLDKIQIGEKANVFKQNCKDYLENLTVKIKSLNQQNLLCSSDIIESYFGKFKTKVNPNNRSGLTEFIFTVATFGKTFSVEETKKALENIKCKDLVLIKNHAKTT